jgi:hypothetical protein
MRTAALRSEDSNIEAHRVERLLDERQAASLLGVSIGTLRRRRLQRLPPAWVRLGGRILYKPSLLAEFVEANIIIPASGNASATEFEG